MKYLLHLLAILKKKKHPTYDNSAEFTWKKDKLPIRHSTPSEKAESAMYTTVFTVSESKARSQNRSKSILRGDKSPQKIMYAHNANTKDETTNFKAKLAWQSGGRLTTPVLTTKKSNICYCIIAKTLYRLQLGVFKDLDEAESNAPGFISNKSRDNNCIQRSAQNPTCQIHQDHS